MKKVAYITGSRADYGLMSSVLREIEGSEELDLKIIVTGMHVLPEFGNTLDEIKKDRYDIEVIDVSQQSDSLDATPKFLGNLLQKLTEKLVELKPDLLLLLGDRAEMLAGAIAGQYLNIPVAHISGGDVTGNVDDPVRNAITKLSHIHFPISEKSAERIILMGEKENRVFVAGSTSLDNIKSAKFPAKKLLLEQYSLSEKASFIIVVQHPVTAEIDNVEEQMKSTMEAVLKTKTRAIVIYPNADAGGRRTIKVIREFEKKPLIQAFSSLPYLDYLGLLKNAAAIVGNSSSAIVESAALGVPAINIGTRQRGREAAENVITVGYDAKQIAGAIEKALTDTGFRKRCRSVKSPYGNGNSAKKIVQMLGKLKIGPSLLDKNSGQRVLKPKFKRFNDLKPEDIDFDFHTHTSQTDAENTAEEMITQAKKSGLRAIAFTEHVNSSTNWFREFKKQIDELRLGEEMEILIGIEAKPLDFIGTIDATGGIINSSEIVVGSVHRYPGAKGDLIPLKEIPKLGEEKAAETEFRLAMGLLQNKQIDVLGHPFGVYSKFFGTFPAGHLKKLLTESLKQGKAIEINTGYGPDKKKLFKLLSEINPYVSIGSNAHKKSEIAQAFGAIKEVLKK